MNADFSLWEHKSCWFYVSMCVLYVSCEMPYLALIHRESMKTFTSLLMLFQAYIMGFVSLCVWDALPHHLKIRILPQCIVILASPSLLFKFSFGIGSTVSNKAVKHAVVKGPHKCIQTSMRVGRYLHVCTVLHIEGVRLLTECQLARSPWQRAGVRVPAQLHHLSGAWKSHGGSCREGFLGVLRGKEGGGVACAWVGCVLSAYNMSGWGGGSYIL